MATRAGMSSDYPKMVYTAGLAEHTIIHSKEEWPDNYFEFSEARQMPAADEPEAPRSDEKEAALKAEQAKRELAKAKKEERKALMAHLDEHNVQYAKNLSTEKLQELKVALDEHLAKQDSPNDSEQHSDTSGVPRE